MQATRRAISRYLTQHNVTQYSYDFNVFPAGVDATIGVSHFAEVAFVFANTKGVGYDTVVATNPFTDGNGAPEANFKIAKLMSRMWISFIVDLDPNNSGGEFLLLLVIEKGIRANDRIVTCVDWPKYTADNEVNFVFDANFTELAYTAPDNFRVAEIDYIMKNIIGAVGV